MKLPKIGTLSEAITVLAAIVSVVAYIAIIGYKVSTLEDEIKKIKLEQQVKEKQIDILNEYLYSKADNKNRKIIKQKIDKVRENKKPEEKKEIKYTDNNDGTVTDKKTGLMWKKCSEGQEYNRKEKTCFRLAKHYTWKDANKRFRTSVEFARNKDWRLPTLRELRTLVWCSNGTISEFAAYGCGGRNEDKGHYEIPTIDINIFPNTDKDAYISSSSTKNENGKTNYWLRWFSNGGMYGKFKDDVEGSVRLVRDINE